MQRHINTIEALESRRLLSGSIAGVVFNDLNGNGAKDTGEAGIGSTKVFIDLNNNGTPDAGEPNTLSNSLGSYVFTGLAAGNYVVGAVAPAGFKLTTMTAGGLIPLAATHNYPLTGSFADTKGGPALTTGGGTLSATGYTFVSGQGPSLSSALTATSSYSIQVVFTPSTIGGYQKILDFKNRTSDIGLYSLSGQLDFFSGLGFGPVNTFKAGQSADVVLTRDAASKLVTAYVNGVKQFSFTDTGGAATFTGPNAIINILHDDGASENFAGKLTHVSVFNSVLTAAQVTALHKGGTQTHAGEWLVTLAANQVATGRNFAFQKLPPTQIKGIVFNDTNSDGIKQTTETAIANATVFVDANNNGKFDTGEKTAKTAADGSYSFVGLAAGTYHIGLVPQTGFRITTPNTGSPVLTHDYELKGNLKDGLGGVALISGGGTISASGYSFAADKGVELTSGINANSYSIEMRVKIATISGYEKLIDFKSLGSDSGLYDLNGHLVFYSFVTGAATPIAVNTFFDLVLTRNASTKVVTGFVNGVQQFTFTDTSGAASFAGPAWFLKDDTHTNHEASAGTITRLRIYNAPLTAAQVLSLHNGGTPPQAGHEFTITLAAGQIVASENFGEVKIV